MTGLRRFLFAYGQLLVILLVVLAVSYFPAWAQTPTPGKNVTLYLFWGDGCPHCAAAKPFLESLPAKYPGFSLQKFEVYYNEQNYQLFAQMAQKFGVQSLAVPTMFIGPYYMQGYSEASNESIERVIVDCLQNGCVDAGQGILPISDSSTSSAPQAAKSVTPASSPTSQFRPTPTAISTPQPIDQGQTLDLPLVGKVSLAGQSLTLSTLLISFVDGFNPCSLWVLSMLLALTLHTGSRRKVAVIGIVFLTVTAAIYALFIAGLFSVLKLVSFLGWIQAIVALVALFFALVNIKDYFWYKEGISFTIADSHKSGIFKGIRTVMDASQSFWSLIGATVVLSAGVSLVEFSCTAGFPVLWTNLLTSQNVSITVFVLLLILYMLIYQLDELVIFFSALVTLKSSRIEEKHGRVLKLAGGMLMLSLAVVMLIDPSLMNNLVQSLMIFGAAVLATLLVLLLHRVILPRFGIRIGSEFSHKKSRSHSRR